MSYGRWLATLRGILAVGLIFDTTEVVPIPFCRRRDHAMSWRVSDLLSAQNGEITRYRAAISGGRMAFYGLRLSRSGEAFNKDSLYRQDRRREDGR